MSGWECLEDVWLFHLDDGEDAGDETEDASDDREGVRPVEAVLVLRAEYDEPNQHEYDWNEKKRKLSSGNSKMCMLSLIRDILISKFRCRFKMNGRKVLIDENLL